jgi:hypothetical protein
MPANTPGEGTAKVYVIKGKRAELDRSADPELDRSADPEFEPGEAE